MAACIGKGEGEAMLKLADRAETDVRCAIYMHAFQRMDARGAVVKKENLNGTPNWRLQQLESGEFMGGLSNAQVNIAKNAADKAAKGAGTSLDG